MHEFLWRDQGYTLDLQDSGDRARLESAYRNLMSVLLIITETTRLHDALGEASGETETSDSLCSMFFRFFDAVFPGHGTDITNGTLKTGYEAFLSFVHFVQTEASACAQAAEDALSEILPGGGPGKE